MGPVVFHTMNKEGATHGCKGHSDSMAREKERVVIFIDRVGYYLMRFFLFRVVPEDGSRDASIGRTGVTMFTFQVRTEGVQSARCRGQIV